MKGALTLTFWLCLTSVAAQELELSSVNLTVKDGLAGDNVYFILQDREGYIWFSTETGVSRYNGRKFENFSMSDGLADNEVFRMDQDSQGRIWFSAFNGALSYYQQGKFYNRDNDPLLRALRPKGHYINILETSDQTLWFLTLHEIFLIRKDNTFELVERPQPAADGIYAFMEDGEDVLGLVRTAGQRRFFGHSFKEFEFEPFNEEKATTHFSAFIKAHHVFLTPFGQDSQNRYLNSLLHEEIDLQTTVTKIIEEGDYIWLCSQQGALRLYKGQYQSIFLEDHLVTHVLKDREGAYWFATLGNGVFYAPSLGNMSLSVYQGQPLGNISSVLPTESGLLFGGVLGKYGWIKGDKVEIRQVDQYFSRSQIKKILKDTLGNGYLLASESFLLRFSFPDIEKVAELNAKSINFWNGSYIVGNRRFLMGLSPGGLGSLFNVVREKREGRELPQTKDLTFIFDTVGFILDIEPYRDQLMVSSLNGVYALDKSFSLERVPDHPILSERVNDLLAIGDRLMIATHGFGIYIKQEEKWKQVSTKDGLASDITRKVWLRHPDTLWVATNAGISRVLLNGETPQVANITELDGLLSKEVYDLVQVGDALYAGTSQGISKIDINAWGNEEVRPVVKLKQFKVNGASHSTNELQLNHKARNIEIDFEGLHYKSLNRLSYEYRMLGLSEEWSGTEANLVNFGRLSPGQYTFEVKALSAQGTASQPVSLSFTITKPFWHTWWFIATITAVLALVIYWVINLIIQRNKRKTQRDFDFRLKLAEAERRALQSQLNPHFIFNSLNSIQNMVLKSEGEEAYDYLEMFGKLIRRVLEFSEKSLIALGDELTTLDLYLQLERMRLNKEFDYTIKINDQVNPDVLVPSLMIQPYVENAIWHGIMPLNGKRKGLIAISIDGSNEAMTITIADNGVGRPTQSQREGWGTGIAKDLVESANPEYKASVSILDIKSAGQPMGTKVIIKISKLKHVYLEGTNH